MSSKSEGRLSKPSFTRSILLCSSGGAQTTTNSNTTTRECSHDRVPSGTSASSAAVIHVMMPLARELPPSFYKRPVSLHVCAPSPSARDHPHTHGSNSSNTRFPPLSTHVPYDVPYDCCSSKHTYSQHPHPVPHALPHLRAPKAEGPTRSPPRTNPWPRCVPKGVGGVLVGDLYPICTGT